MKIVVIVYERTFAIPRTRPHAGLGVKTCGIGFRAVVIGKIVAVAIGDDIEIVGSECLCSADAHKEHQAEEYSVYVWSHIFCFRYLY